MQKKKDHGLPTVVSYWRNFGCKSMMIDIFVLGDLAAEEVVLAPDHQLFSGIRRAIGVKTKQVIVA